MKVNPAFLSINLFKLISELTAKVSKDNYNIMISIFKVFKRIKTEDFLSYCDLSHLQSSTLNIS